MNKPTLRIRTLEKPAGRLKNQILNVCKLPAVKYSVILHLFILHLFIFHLFILHLFIFHLFILHLFIFHLFIFHLFIQIEPFSFFPFIFSKIQFFSFIFSIGSYTFLQSAKLPIPTMPGAGKKSRTEITKMFLVSVKLPPSMKSRSTTIF